MGKMKSGPYAEKVRRAAESACALLETGNHRAALRRINQCVRENRGEGWPLLLRSRIKQNMGLDRLAIADVTRAFDRDPDCGWIFDLPLERLAMPDAPWARALYKMNRDYRTHSGSYAVHAFVGKLKTMRGLGKEGLAHLDFAVRHRPNLAYLLTWRAEINRRLGNKESALQDLKTALRSEPRQSVAHATLAALLREEGRFEKALEHARASWKFSSTYETGPLEAAKISLAMGDARGVFVWLARAVERAGRYGWRNVGTLQDFEHLAQDPVLNQKIWRSRWMGWQGEALLGMGRSGEAVRLLENGVSLDSSFAWAWAWLGEALFRCADLDKASACLKRGLSLKPLYARAWVEYGRLQLERERYPDALTAFHHALKIDPYWAWSLYWRAQAFLNLERLQEAKKDLDHALKLDPGFKQAEILCSQLKQRRSPEPR